MSDDIRREIAAEAQAEKDAHDAAERAKAEARAAKRAESPAAVMDFAAQIDDDLRRNMVGDARRFAELFRQRLAYDSTQGVWYAYNCTRWHLDLGRQAATGMEEVASDYDRRCATLEREAKALEEIDSSKEGLDKAKAMRRKAEACRKRAFALRSTSRINSVLEAAATSANLGITGSEWNRHPNLFAAANTVLDLATGRQMDPRPDHYLNLASQVEWRGLNAEAPLWEQFLDQIFLGDKELIRYVARLCGYFLTGYCNLQEFYCLWGPRGRNGKGVFFRTLRQVLGEYYGAIPSAMLLSVKEIEHAQGPNPLLLSLRDRRLAVASETSKRAKFSEEAIKLLSGGDPLQCRGLYSGNLVSFVPHFKMLFATNRIPSVDGGDEAFKQRLRVIPFYCKFVPADQADPAKKLFPIDLRLEEKLHTPESLSGILAWMVREGSIPFLEHMSLGQLPEAVSQETREYFDANDLIGEFIRDCLVICEIAARHPDQKKTQMKDIYENFATWCVEEKKMEAKHVPSLRTFGSDLKGRSEIQRVAPHNVYCYNVLVAEREKWGTLDQTDEVPF